MSSASVVGSAIDANPQVACMAWSQDMRTFVIGLSDGFVVYGLEGPSMVELCRRYVPFGVMHIAMDGDSNLILFSGKGTEHQQRAYLWDDRCYTGVLEKRQRRFNHNSHVAENGTIVNSVGRAEDAVDVVAAQAPARSNPFEEPSTSSLLATVSVGSPICGLRLRKHCILIADCWTTNVYDGSLNHIACYFVPQPPESAFANPMLQRAHDSVKAMWGRAVGESQSPSDSTTAAMNRAALEVTANNSNTIDAASELCSLRGGDNGKLEYTFLTYACLGDTPGSLVCGRALVHVSNPQGIKSADVTKQFNQVSRIQPHENGIQALSVERSGQYAVSVSTMGTTIKLMSLQDWKPVVLMEFHRGNTTNIVPTLSINDEHKLVAALSITGTLHFFSYASLTSSSNSSSPTGSSAPSSALAGNRFLKGYQNRLKGYLGSVGPVCSFPLLDADRDIETYTAAPNSGIITTAALQDNASFSPSDLESTRSESTPSSPPGAYANQTYVDSLDPPRATRHGGAGFDSASSPTLVSTVTPGSQFVAMTALYSCVGITTAPTPGDSDVSRRGSNAYAMVGVGGCETRSKARVIAVALKGTGPSTFSAARHSTHIIPKDLL